MLGRNDNNRREDQTKSEVGKTFAPTVTRVVDVFLRVRATSYQRNTGFYGSG